MPVAASTKKQWSMSCWQSDCVPVLEQNVPAAVQPAGPGLHEQAALPAAPPQLWRAPQAVGPADVTQPWASATQVVTSVPVEQNVPAWPVVQAPGAALHEQDALPGLPVHVSFDVQIVGVPLTKKQVLASCVQVASWPLVSQNVPATPQVDALHSQRPVFPLQVWR